MDGRHHIPRKSGDSPVTLFSSDWSCYLIVTFAFGEKLSFCYENQKEKLHFSYIKLSKLTTRLSVVSLYNVKQKTLSGCNVVVGKG